MKGLAVPILRSFLTATGSLCVSLWASPAIAQICDLVVYTSDSGAIGREASRPFSLGEEFVVCFRLTEPGFISLWDRMPADGRVERLVPNAHSRDPDGALAKRLDRVGRHCFGDTSGSYWLHMEPADGAGLGVLWLVYGEDAARHPTESSFNISQLFDEAYDYYGAGAGGGARAPEGVCQADAGILRYHYRVEGR